MLLSTSRKNLLKKIFVLICFNQPTTRSFRLNENEKIFFPSSFPDRSSLPRQIDSNENLWIFPDNLKPPNSRNRMNRFFIPEMHNPTSNCKLSTGTVYYRGQCERILARGSCASDEWLIVTPSGIPNCEKRPCDWGQLLFKDKCVNLTYLNHCSPGQVIYADFSGSTYCDCEHGYIYDPLLGRCLAEHTRGQCSFGKYMELSKNSGEIECVPNPCYIDGYVYIKKYNRCFRKLYNGKCEYLVTPNINDFTANCLSFELHNIFEVPTLRHCPKGSRRDFHNQCRKAFRIATYVTQRTFYGKCKIGFTKDRIGNCRKVSSLFS